MRTIDEAGNWRLLKGRSAYAIQHKRTRSTIYFKSVNAYRIAEHMMEQVRRGRHALTPAELDHRIVMADRSISKPTGMLKALAN